MPPVPVEQAFALALQHHQAGRLAEAEALYRQVLDVQSRHAEARHYLGVLAHQVGRNDLAVEWIRGALTLAPNNPAAYSNLGAALCGLRRFDEAVTACGRAVELQPDYPEAHFNLGNALRERGRLEAAIVQYRRALALKPDFETAQYNLANTLRDHGQFHEAVVAFQRLLHMRPDFAEGHLNLGCVLATQGRREEALAAFRRAVAIKPDYADAHYNLGNTLREGDALEEALAAYRRALAVKPDFLEAYLNLGKVLSDQSRFEDAVAAFRRALELRPDNPDAYLNLGETLMKQGRHDEALAAFHRALALKPQYPEAQLNVGAALTEQGRLDEAAAAFGRALELKPDYAQAHYNLGNVFRERVNLDAAVVAYRRALEFKFDHSDTHNNLGITLSNQGLHDDAMAAFRAAIELEPADAKFLSNLIFGMHCWPACDARTLQEAQARWNRLYVDPMRPFWRAHANDPNPSRHLKIGYLSPDFCAHPVSFFLTPLLEAHDHETCEIYCYSTVRRPDAVTERLRESADVWREVRTYPDDRLAECIAGDGIDILVDLAMHTGNNRLPVFARKPAPVQVSWLAYPGSTGIEAIDYRLTDARIDPPGEVEAGPGESPVRLPDAWCCYAPIGEFPAVSPLPAEKTGTVTFGSLNQFGKIHEGLIGCWAKLLDATPGSQLLIVSLDGQAKERIHGLFDSLGIARERVQLLARCPWAEYIQLFEGIDIALDAYPCNGMTTTCHALWMGAPVVTWKGTSAASRAGDSLLRTVGLPEWVARDEEEYIRIATQWAGDLPRLAELRRTLRARMQASPLMDAPRFARHVESAYRTMWQQWCADKPSRPR